MAFWGLGKVTGPPDVHLLFCLFTGGSAESVLKCNSTFF